MSGDQMAGVVGSVLCLVLVGSALAARRLEGRRLAAMALAWGAILVALVVMIRLLGLA